MISKSTILHLRIPFSIFLMPIFCFAASQSIPFRWIDYLLIFIILHLLLYPASNAFNSYFDKDENSIGGLKYPPKVTKELLLVSILLDLFAVILGLYFNITFSILLLMYGLISKAYSHDKIRLKKYPIISLLTVAVFQGVYCYLAIILAFNDLSFNELFQLQYLFPGVLTSLLLLGSYPITQVYQHAEDARRNDLTFSRLLGIKGTFIFTGICFVIANIGFFFYLNQVQFVVFQLFLLPVIGYFFIWAIRVWNDENNANYDATMFLSKLSSYSLILYFTLITFMKL